MPRDSGRTSFNVASLLTIIIRENIERAAHNAARFDNCACAFARRAMLKTPSSQAIVR
jgi:hypothetical protein